MNVMVPWVSTHDFKIRTIIPINGSLHQLSISGSPGIQRVVSINRIIACAGGACQIVVRQKVVVENRVGAVEPSVCPMIPLTSPNMTSNVGAELIRKTGSLGFKAQKEEVTYQDMKEKLLEAVKHSFKPEFLNRIDDIIVFRQLIKDDLMRIIDLEIALVIGRLKDQGISLEVSKEAKEFLVEKGFDPVFGARPLKRTSQRFLEDSLAQEIISKKYKEGSLIKVTRKNEELIIE